MPATFQLENEWLESAPDEVALDAEFRVERAAKSVWNFSVIGTCTSA